MLVPRLIVTLIIAALAMLFMAISIMVDITVGGRMQQERDYAIDRLSDAAADHVSYLRVQWTNIGEQVQALRRLGQEITRAHLAGNAGQVEHLQMQVLPRALAAGGADFLRMGGVDASGRLLWSSLATSLPRVDVSDREHVRAIIVDHHEQFVGEPVISRISGRLTINFSFAVRDEQEVLRGVVIISITKERSERVDRMLEREGGWQSFLVRGDGRILSAVPDAPDLRSLDLTLYEWSRAPAQSVWTARGRIGEADAPSTLAMSRVPGFDLSVVVALDETIELAPLLRTQALATRLLHVLYGGVVVSWLAVSGLVYMLARVVERRARDSLDRTRLDLLTQIASRANDMILLVDRDHGLRFANAAMMTWLPQPRDAGSAGRSATPVMEPIWTAITDALGTILDSGRGQRSVVPVGASRDDPHWIALDMTPVRLRVTTESRSDALLVIGRDVTDLKRAELEVVRLLEEQYLVTRTGPGVPYRAVVDADRRHSLTLPAGTGRLSHLLATDRPGGPLSILPDDQALLDGLHPQLIERGEATVEYRVLSATGAVHVLRDSCVRVVADDGHMVVSGYLVDVSQEREREDQVRKLQQLWMLGELAGGLAHELNQPLAAISFASENALIALESGAEGVPHAIGKLELIGDMVERAGRIVRTMRQAGETTPENVQPMNLMDVITGAVDTIQWRLDEDAVVVHSRCDVEAPIVAADAGLLEQVFVNLIVNSCDAYRDKPSDPGMPKAIEITMVEQAPMICVRVADRAGGIPESVMARLFEPFQTTKPGGKGTGLGLPIIYNIVNRFGGTISVRNEERGAVVEICLPRAVSD